MKSKDVTIAELKLTDTAKKYIALEPAKIRKYKNNDGTYCYSVENFRIEDYELTAQGLNEFLEAMYNLFYNEKKVEEK